MNKLVSYYDLLGMIKEGNIPEKVYWINNRNEKIPYKAEFELGVLNGYFLEERKNRHEDIAYYLGENFLESTIFKECIEIPNDDFEDIEEVTYKPRKIQNAINSLIKNQRKIINMLKDENEQENL